VAESAEASSHEGPVRVIHLITGLNSGGAEMMLYKLLSAFDRDRFEMQVVSMTDGGVFGERIGKLGIRVTCLSMRRGVASISAGARLIALLRRERPSILQTWMYHADLLGTLSGLLARVPTLIWNIRASDLDFNATHRSLRKVFAVHAMLSRAADVVIVNSNSGRRFHESRNHAPPRWEVIHNGFDTRRFRPDSKRRSRIRADLKIDDISVVIGMIARFDGQKDHESFFRAAAIVAKNQPCAVFVLAGKGVDAGNRTIERWLSQYGLANRVRLLGEVDDVSGLLPAIDIVALASSSGEGLPNALGEAMCCAVPCIASNVGDSAFLIGETGKVVPPKDPTALAVACQELIDIGHEGRVELGERARRRIVDNFDVTEVVTAYENLYSELRFGRKQSVTGSGVHWDERAASDTKEIL